MHLPSVLMMFKGLPETVIKCNIIATVTMYRTLMSICVTIVDIFGVCFGSLLAIDNVQDIAATAYPPHHDLSGRHYMYVHASNTNSKL